MLAPKRIKLNRLADVDSAGYIYSVFPRLSQATDFLFRVFYAAVVSWGDHSMPLLLGIRAQWFPWQPNPRPPAVQHGLYGKEPLKEHSLPPCILGLAHSLPLLLAKEPWSSQTHKVSAGSEGLGGGLSVSAKAEPHCVCVCQFIDWLLSVIEAPRENLSVSSLSAVKGERHKLTLMSYLYIC